MQNKMPRDRESKSANEVAPAAISADLQSMARGPRGSGNYGGVGQNLLTVQTGLTHVQSIGESFGGMSVQSPSLFREPLLETIPQPLDSWNIAFQLLVCEPARNTQAHDVRHVFCAGAASSFLACSMDHRVE